jgi:hypothetical protein
MFGIYTIPNLAETLSDGKKAMDGTVKIPMPLIAWNAFHYQSYMN